MEIENHKEEVPFEHYLEKYGSLDPHEAAGRLNIVYDDSKGKFHFRFMGYAYEAAWPEFEITSPDVGAGDLLMTSLPAKTFILRYLLEGQYVRSSGRFMTFREVPVYGELYNKPFDGRCIKRLTYGFGYKLPVFSAAMERIPGAERIKMGDVAYEFELIDGYRMRFIFWEGDDEFPPSAQILYSDNFQFGFHAEDMVVAGDLSITTLKKLSA
ncbi:MAG: DUF3786 domain-containing protein [Lachnospiraceae bacterium]|nr:DUF3786 domain-containing protein [Lachnospiraceae bacterium]